MGTVLFQGLESAVWRGAETICNLIGQLVGSLATDLRHVVNTRTAVVWSLYQCGCVLLARKQKDTYKCRYAKLVNDYNGIVLARYTHKHTHTHTLSIE